jgi:hypothetical protein
MWAGVMLVAGSALVGGRLFASADRTVSVWSVAHDVPLGHVVSSTDLVRTDVHFDDRTAEDRYLLVATAIPAGAQAAYPLSEGELLARSALDQAVDTAPELPLGVPATDMPADLAAGQHVAIWSAPSEGDRGGHVTLVLSDVVVRSVSRAAASDVATEREVLIEVDSLDDVEDTLRELGGGRIVLVRVGS